MMDPTTGNVVMLDDDRIHDTTYIREITQALNAMRGAPTAGHLADIASVLAPDPVIVYGTEESIEALSSRVRLGQAERERRANRRRQQKNSRRRNR